MVLDLRLTIEIGLSWDSLFSFLYVSLFPVFNPNMDFVFKLLLEIEMSKERWIRFLYEEPKETVFWFFSEKKYLSCIW